MTKEYIELSDIKSNHSATASVITIFGYLVLIASVLGFLAFMNSDIFYLFAGGIIASVLLIGLGKIINLLYSINLKLGESKTNVEKAWLDTSVKQ